MSNIYGQHVIPFTITAANVNLADTADQSVYTFNSNSSVIRVPTSLIVGWKGGTAYTVGGRKGTLIGRDTERAAAATYDLSNLDQVPSLNFYLTHPSGSGRRVQLLFRVPIIELGLVGVLDNATGSTTGSKSSLVAFPVPDKKFFTSNEYGSLVVHSNVSLSGGTGDISGQFAFEEYPAL